MFVNSSDGIDQEEVREKVSSVRMTSELTTVFICGTSFALAGLAGRFLLASEVGTPFVVSKGLETQTWNEPRICVYPFI